MPVNLLITTELFCLRRYCFLCFGTHNAASSLFDNSILHAIILVDMANMNIILTLILAYIVVHIKPPHRRDLSHRQFVGGFLFERHTLAPVSQLLVHAASIVPIFSSLRACSFMYPACISPLWIKQQML